MEKREKTRLHTAIFFTAFTATALFVAPFYFSWLGLAVGFTVWFIANCPGVGAGFHRLLTHRGYEVPKGIEYFLAILGCLALQGSPTQWVAVHRMHHKYVEQEGKDPHTPRQGSTTVRGFAWAQWLWMLLPNPPLEDDVIKRYAPDLSKDDVHKLIHKYWWLPSIILGAVLLYFGWPNPSLFLWAGVVPVAVGWQITWMVNSVTHMKEFGTRRFNTPDDSRNSFLVAVFTFGEGWHNNHHAYPTSARHGLAWWEIDMNFYVIRILAFLSLASKLKLASLKLAPLNE